MTITEALQSGRKFKACSESEKVEYLGTFNHSETPIKHLFRVTTPFGNQYMSFTNNNGEAYYWGPDAGRNKSADIFIVKEKKTMWINVWKNGSGQIESSPHPHTTKEMAEKAMVTFQLENLYGTFPIQIEL